MLAVFGAWRESDDKRAWLQDELTRVLPTKTRVPFVIRRQGLMLTVELSSPGALMAALDITMRGERDWACGLLLRPPPSPQLPSLRTFERAKRTPNGLLVRRDTQDPRVNAVQTALELHVIQLRRRTEKDWRAIDAARAHRTAVEAARELGCTPQAVTKHLRSSRLKTTDQTPVLLSALLNMTEQRRAA